MTELPATFGKYYLTEKLATGGMAEIYLGKILGPGGFEKQLVIKQIHPGLGGKRQFVDLFVAEAKTLVSLNHGNIVPVYELGVIEDRYFIAMEYIDGPTLYRLTEAVSRSGARMTPPLAAWVAAKILDGLDYAHRKGDGVIHRDLSPRNVMLSRDGEVKLVDFGIAITFGDPGEVESDGSAPTGSYPYMSPEQVRRQRLSTQSDLFSAGVLLWEMLTGERLFARSSAEDTLDAVLEAPIRPPSAVRPEVPARLDEVVVRALARDPDQRWRSAADFLAPLQRYLYSLDEPPGARDLAKLIARYCPPVATGRPTTEGAPLTPPLEGPATVPVARDGSGPKGKRSSTVREQTFATHVAFEEVLLRATPLFPIAAIRDDLVPRTTPLPRPAPAARDATASPAEASLVAPEPARDASPAPSSRRTVLWIAAAAAVLLAGTGVFWLRSRAGDHPAASGQQVGARSGLAGDAAIATVLGGDAGVEAPADASLDAAPSLDAGGRAPRASGELKVGANPWGEVYVDGKRLGRTPGTWPIPVGNHKVEVRFPETDPPGERVFPVVIKAGEETAVFAEFAP